MSSEKELDKVGFDNWKTKNGDDNEGVIDICGICDDSIYRGDKYFVDRSPFVRNVFCETCYLEKKEYEDNE